MIKLLKKILLKFGFEIKKKQKNKNKERKNVVIMKSSIVSEDSNIGEYTYIGFNSIITKSYIGRYCSIANNVSIGMGEHRINRVSTSALFYEKPYEILTEKDCIIGNDVWLGQNVVIRRGVTIGDGAIVGANSFVNKDIEAFSIVVGSPAKEIAKRFDEKTILSIKKSKWWLKNKEEAQSIINKLSKELNIENDK